MSSSELPPAMSCIHPAHAGTPDALDENISGMPLFSASKLFLTTIPSYLMSYYTQVSENSRARTVDGTNDITNFYLYIQ